MNPERPATASIIGAIGHTPLVDRCPGSKPGWVNGAQLARVTVEASRLTAVLGAFRADRFDNEGNSNARYHGTAPELWRQSDLVPDGYLKVTSADAVHWARRLAKQEGVFAGYSSGANLAAAVALLKGPLAGATIAIIACDSGLKYPSTDLW
jgi:cysteine synthase